MLRGKLTFVCVTVVQAHQPILPDEVCVAVKGPNVSCGYQDRLRHRGSCTEGAKVNDSLVEYQELLMK